MVFLLSSLDQTFSLSSFISLSFDINSNGNINKWNISILNEVRFELKDNIYNIAEINGFGFERSPISIDIDIDINTIDTKWEAK